jgi:hypothetical protein
MKDLVYLLICWGMLAGMASGADLSDPELARIGRKVWINECDGTVAGLTSWNEGEEFASLGIGHFIWYPAGRPGPFEESFPALTEYLAEQGRAIPGWMRGHCPWGSRAEFMEAQRSERMEALRNLLAQTVPLQARFLARRMQEALPKMLAEAPPGEAERVRRNFGRLAATGAGTFALIEYVHFKGEGTLEAAAGSGSHAGGWGCGPGLLGISKSDARPAGARLAAGATRGALVARMGRPGGTVCRVMNFLLFPLSFARPLNEGCEIPPVISISIPPQSS